MKRLSLDERLLQEELGDLDNAGVEILTPEVGQALSEALKGAGRMGREEMDALVKDLQSKCNKKPVQKMSLLKIASRKRRVSGFLKKRKAASGVQDLLKGYLDIILNHSHTWYAEGYHDDDGYFEAPYLSDSGFRLDSFDPKTLSKLTKMFQEFADCVGDDILSKYDLTTMGSDFFVEQQQYDDGFFDRIYDGDEKYLSDCFDSLKLPARESTIIINSKDKIEITF